MSRQRHQVSSLATPTWCRHATAREHAHAFPTFPYMPAHLSRRLSMTASPLEVIRGTSHRLLPSVAPPAGCLSRPHARHSSRSRWARLRIKPPASSTDQHAATVPPRQHSPHHAAVGHPSLEHFTSEHWRSSEHGEHGLWPCTLAVQAREVPTVVANGLTIFLSIHFLSPSARQLHGRGHYLSHSPSLRSILSPLLSLCSFIDHSLSNFSLYPTSCLRQGL